MSAYYVYSGASGSGDGSSWANAYTTLAGALSGKSAGTTYYVAHDHSESSASAVSLAFPGTPSNPDYVICVNRAGSVPPVSADIQTSPSAVLATSSSATWAVSGSVYFFGVDVQANNNVGIAKTAGNKQYWKDCRIWLTHSGSVELDMFPSSVANSSTLDWRNVVVKFTDSFTTGIHTGGGYFRWRDTPSGAIDPASGGFPTTLFATLFVGTNVLLKNLDLSALGSGKTIFPGATLPSEYQMINCQLGASVTIGTNPTSPGAKIDAVECDSGTGFTHEEHYDYAGSVITETSVVRSGGFTSGGVGKSLKMTSTANVSRFLPLESPPIYFFNTSTGSAKTLSISIVSDGVTLKDTECWVDIDYMGSSSYAIGTLASDGVDVLNAGTAQASDSGSTWGGSLGSPVKQSLSPASVTPQLDGVYRAIVRLAKPSTTVYIDPLIQGV